MAFFSWQSYLILKRLEKTYDRGIFLIIRFPEQYNNEFKREERSQGISEEEDGNVVLDMLDNKQKGIDQLFTRKRQKYLDVYFLAESYFDLSRKTIGNISHKIFCLNNF